MLPRLKEPFTIFYAPFMYLATRLLTLYLPFGLDLKALVSSASPWNRLDHGLTILLTRQHSVQ